MNVDDFDPLSPNSATRGLQKVANHSLSPSPSINNSPPTHHKSHIPDRLSTHFPDNLPLPPQHPGSGSGSGSFSAVGPGPLHGHGHVRHGTAPFPIPTNFKRSSSEEVIPHRRSVGDTNVQTQKQHTNSVINPVITLKSPVKSPISSNRSSSLSKVQEGDDAFPIEYFPDFSKPVGAAGGVGTNTLDPLSPSPSNSGRSIDPPNNISINPLSPVDNSRRLSSPVVMRDFLDFNINSNSNSSNFEAAAAGTSPNPALPEVLKEKKNSVVNNRASLNAPANNDILSSNLSPSMTSVSIAGSMTPAGTSRNLEKEKKKSISAKSQSRRTSIKSPKLILETIQDRPSESLENNDDTDRDMKHVPTNPSEKRNSNKGDGTSMNSIASPKSVSRVSSAHHSSSPQTLSPSTSTRGRGDIFNNESIPTSPMSSNRNPFQEKNDNEDSWRALKSKASTSLGFAKTVLCWRFNWKGEDHEILLFHSLMSGKRTIKVDGVEVFKMKKMIDSGSRHELVVNHSKDPAIKFNVAVVIGCRSNEFSYELEIEGLKFDDAQLKWSEENKASK